MGSQLPNIGAKVFIVTGTLALIWLSIAVTSANIFPNQWPEGVLTLWRGSAEAKATLAVQLAETTPENKRAIANARSLATQALGREPVNPAAAYALALAAQAEGDDGGAERLLVYSQSLSRRYLPTQLALIDQSFRTGDIRAVLRHYDLALRTNKSANETLLPKLMEAILNRQDVAAAAVETIGVRPPWWRTFYGALLAMKPVPAVLAPMATRLQLDPSETEERELLIRSLASLVDTQRYRPALALYRAARPGDGEVSPIRAPVTGSMASLPPFDWDLVDDAGFGAIAEDRPESKGGSALSLLLDSGRAGIVARQLLMLEPGRYSLSVVVGDVSGASLGRSSLVAHCAGGPGKLLGSLVLPVADSKGERASFSFAVPNSGCEAQWLAIETGGNMATPSSSVPWLGDFAVVPLNRNAN